MSSLLDKNPCSLEKKIQVLAPLVEKIKKCSGNREKLALLDQFFEVKNFLKRPSFIRTFLAGLSLECEIIIKSLIAIGQGERVFYFPEELPNPTHKLRELLESLFSVEKFYSEIGGIVGYHWMMLQFLMVADEEKSLTDDVIYHRAEGIDISQKCQDMRRAAIWGIERLRELAEIYPVGGAADRLRLLDEKTGAPLPAAKLLFRGKTLLEGMINDLQAREYLHYKLYGNQIQTPIAMMTSQEKDNHAQILSICEEQRWFGRLKENFRFFCQSSVPTINKEGDWCLQSPMQLLLKPGGHGVIWKLARDEGVFDWLFSLNRKKALIRQINNPIAGLDDGLATFTGFGCAQNKIFGFASCPRQVKASEGINVLIEKRGVAKSEYTLTNIEYCDFKKFNIADIPCEMGSEYSQFSSNTNILFIDLSTICQTVSICPIPGMIVNLKMSAYRNERGEVKEEEIARLESTMQNIADCFKGSDKSTLSTFITHNARSKTISTVKREYAAEATLVETPEGCFLDTLKNGRELLVDTCGMHLPKLEFCDNPSFIFFYHPALGPLYPIISQKIRNGCMKEESELQLNISEIFMENLDLEGSLQIYADDVMGHEDQGILKYSENCGKCVLKNVKVRNAGIDWDAPNIFWKNEIFRKESCQIRIHGNGEFYAEDVTLNGNLIIEVEPMTRVIAFTQEGHVQFRRESISKPSWFWKYEVDANYNIVLKSQLQSYQK